MFWIDNFKHISEVPRSQGHLQLAHLNLASASQASLRPVLCCTLYNNMTNKYEVHPQYMFCQFPARLDREMMRSALATGLATIPESRQFGESQCKDVKLI